MTIVSFEGFRRAAQKRLPRFLFDYIDGGSFSEATLAANRRDLDAVTLKQRVLRDMTEIDTSCTLFGETYGLPVVLAPVGLAGMNARRGEVQAAKAAEAAGVPFTLSTVSVCPLGEVAAAIQKPFWFQLYMLKDRGFMRDLLAKAREAGCSALVFTVDMPVPGVRYRDYDSGLAGASGLMGHARRFMQAAMHPRWAFDVGLLGRPHHLGNVAPVLKGRTGLEDFFAWMARNFDPSITWDDLAFIRAEWDGPLILKGLLDVQDARDAVSLGADGIVVSNHGGRQLDGAPSSARILPAIADAVGGDVAILADGGVRTGADVVKMLALGADAVMVGRAWAYALAAGGGPAVAALLANLEKEIRVVMTLVAAASVGATDREVLVSG